jgi:hypothetical protein
MRGQIDHKIYYNNTKFNDYSLVVNLRMITCRFVITILLLLLLCTLSGCNGAAKGYKTFSVKKGIACFTLECPVSYWKSKVEVRNDEQYQYTDVTLSGKTTEKLAAPTIFYVFVDSPVDFPDDSQTALDERLSSLSKKMADFHLIDEYPLTIDGIQGYGAVYTRTALVPFGHRGEPTPRVMRKAVVLQDGFVWMLTMDSYAPEAEADKAIFDHILKTFKFIPCNEK